MPSDNAAMTPLINSFAFSFGLFFCMLACLEIGRRIGSRRMAHDPEGADKGISAIEGAVFALFGLLLAFTFSGAATRFDHRRELITQEANSIGTAYLRIDLLPAASQPPLRALYREYVASRLATYSKLPDIEAVRIEADRSLALQAEIWKRSTAAAHDADTPAVANLVLPPLNDMIDITTTRLVASQTHPPDVIYYMLFALALACALLAGFSLASSKARQWLHMLGFAAVVSTTIYVTMDMEYPRQGLIRIDAADHLLVDLLKSMKQ